MGNRHMAAVVLFLVFLSGCGSPRFNNLTLALSAGQDSRVVLASCRKVRHKISCYTGRQPGVPKDHADIVVPTRLLAKLNVKQDLIDSHDVKLRSEFVKVFKSNVPFAHDKMAPRQQANLDYYNLKKIAVLGNVSEVACIKTHWLKVRKRELAARETALTMKLDGHPFAVKYFEKWLSGLGEIYNVNGWDLYHWEHICASWLASFLLESTSRNP